MKKTSWLSLASLGSLFLFVACGAREESPKPPPVTSAVPAPSTSALARSSLNPYPPTRTVDVIEALHGVRVADPYRWLEDGKSPEVKAWLDAQDALARAELAKLPGRDALRARLKEVFYVDSLSAPSRRGGRYFYTRRKADQEKKVVYYREGKKGEEHVLLDPNAWSKDGSSSLGIFRVSRDGKYVAYTVHENNSDEATLFVLEVGTGKRLEKDTIVGAKYADPSWTPKGDGFYYTWLPVDPKIPSADRPGFAEVRFHALGTDPAKDVVVRERTGDPSTFISSEISQDGHFLFLTVEHGWTSNDLHFKDLRKGPARDWKPLAVGADAHVSVEAYKDQLYVLTDEKAPNKRVFKVSPERVARESWKELIGERKDATLQSASVVGGKLAVVPLKNATHRFEIYDLEGKLVRDLTLPGLGSVSGPVGLPEDDEAFFYYESFSEPMTVFSTSIKSGGLDVYSRVKVPFDAAPYVTEQVFYPSKDGTRVSMFVVHKKDLVKDGRARAMLYGYGGFLSNELPSFVPSMIPWLEQGGVYAVPNLRGGGEYGEEWHRGGMKRKKQNVFDDYIAAAEYLIREKFTSPSHLALYGASNGGLLVGAAMTQRPDLYGAVLCGVPLLDMLRYHLSGGGMTWTSEYGSSDDAEDFRALYAYSPYHHVTDAPYPPLLMLSADSDDRVDPMHARKFVAAMQARSKGGPVLLRVEKNSGHGGADLRRAEVEKAADRLAFALANTAK